MVISNPTTHKPAANVRVPNKAAFNPYDATFNIGFLQTYFNGNNRAAAHSAIGGYLAYFSQPRSAGSTALLNAPHVQHQRRYPNYGGPRVLINPPEKKSKTSKKPAKPKKPETPIHHKDALITPGPKGNNSPELTDGMLMRRMEKLGMSTEEFGEGGEQLVITKQGSENWVKVHGKWRVGESHFNDGKGDRISNDRMIKIMDGKDKTHDFYKGNINKDPFVRTLDEHGNEVNWMRFDNKDGSVSWQKESIAAEYSSGCDHPDPETPVTDADMEALNMA
jgi:hypothetical protein